MQSPKSQNYYKVLGINTSASAQEIKTAYRNLARKYHPDVNPGNKLCEEKFKEIGEAYNVLGSQDLKRKYDLSNGYNIDKYSAPKETKEQAKQAYNNQKSTNTQKTKDPDKKTDNEKKQSSDKNKKTDKEKGFFSDILGGMFKEKEEDSKKNNKTKKEDPPKTNKQKSFKGKDIYTDITINAAEAHNGAVRKVNILHTEKCRKCNGKRLINDLPCMACEGNGETSTHKKLNIKVPAGVKNNSKIKVSAEGNKGTNGGESGDLYLVIKVEKNSLFKFDKNDVICEIPITPSEAALGAEFKVPTLEGSVLMKIPAETISGQKFRLVAQGLKDSKTSKKGDQFVIVKIEIPKNLTKQEKELYHELAKVRHYNPRESLFDE